MSSSKEDAAGAFADKHRIKYVETSAKSGEGIQEAFETLAAECIKTR